jgi:large exoprotein involved in heme utilization and adhesion
MSKDGKLLSSAFSIVEETGVGEAGDIQISGDSLSLTNDAQLVASTRGKGDGGNVILDIRDKVFLDTGDIFSGVEKSGVGNSGSIRISADSVSLTNGAQLIAATLGKGDAGRIEINSKNSVTVLGTSSITGRSSALFTSTDSNSTGLGGNITINTDNLSISDGAVLDARTENNRNGGNIILDVRQALILNGGQLISTSVSSGNGGKITVHAADRVIISGNDNTFNNRVAQFGAEVAPVSASSGLFVRSQSTGSTGEIEITAPKILLDNTATISAESESGNSGNINLFPKDLLLHRRGSQISTTAGTARQPGNGGNINIIAPHGFVVAIPNENSDISANAFTGAGGRVNLEVQGIFGIASRNRPTPTSDITASSELGIPGIVQINTPNPDFSLGLVKLPLVLVDASALIDSGCIATAGDEKSEFYITGRGGLPLNPREAFHSNAVITRWVTLDKHTETLLNYVTLPTSLSEHSTDNQKRSTDASTSNPFNPSRASQPLTTTPVPIVPATGWVFNGQGDVTLISHAPRAPFSSPTCAKQ